MTADRSSMTNFSRCYWRKWRIKPRAAACSLPLRPRKRMSWGPNSQVCHHEHYSADHPTCPFRILRGNQMHLVRRLRQLWHMVGREVFAGGVEVASLASVPLLRCRLPRQRFGQNPGLPLSWAPWSCHPVCSGREACKYEGPGHRFRRGWCDFLGGGGAIGPCSEEQLSNHVRTAQYGELRTDDGRGESAHVAGSADEHEP